MNILINNGVQLMGVEVSETKSNLDERFEKFECVLIDDESGEVVRGVEADCRMDALKLEVAFNACSKIEGVTAEARRNGARIKWKLEQTAKRICREI